MAAPTEATSVRTHPPHLSHSRISRYDLCPEQYRLYYIEGLRPKIESANLVFGKLIHRALESLFRDGADPVERFEREWEATQDHELAYGQRDSWEKLRGTGQALLQRFLKDSAGRITDVSGVEQRFETEVTSLDVPVIGFVDLVANLDGKKTLIDFKTSGSSCPGHEADLSDQLTVYWLFEPEAEQTALCVLVKTKEPRIDWLVSRRNGSQLAEYLAKVELVAEGIAKRRFYKRPGMWCRWCDFLPVCLGDQKKTRETLVLIEPDGASSGST